MVRVLLREAILTALCLVAVSALVFAALDLLGRPDWFDTTRHAAAVGLTPDHAGARDLPLFWNRRVEDTQVRTARDLAALADPDRRAEAEARLAHRGTAALPYLLLALPRMTGDTRQAALRVLALWCPALTGGDHAPPGEAAALDFWDRFMEVRGLDFRPGYALRRAQRFVAHPSRNASEQLTRLGTYALPAVFQVLGTATDRDARLRLTAALADITGIPLRAAPDASEAELTRVVDAWRAFWFAEHLEYGPLTGWQQAAGHVTQTRYGRWATRALRGRFGRSRLTGRPAGLEVRDRLPTSALASGLGGLLGVAVVVAFGGEALRRRPLRTKLLDLMGATVPGLVALGAAFVALVQLCAPRGDTLPVLDALSHAGWRLLPTTALIAAVSTLWLRRPSVRLTLHLVRVEAESWATESLSPHFRQVVRHGARIGVGSMLAPLGLAAPGVLLASLLVEPVTGLRGMGTLTASALVRGDAPWLMVATLTVVPLLLGRRWARRMLVWVLEEPHRAEEPEASEPAPEAPADDVVASEVPPVSG